MSRHDGDPPDLGSRATPWVGILAGAAVLAVVGIQAWLLGLLVAFTCDEACTYNKGYGNPTHEPWRQAADSWQWDAIPLLAGLGFIAAVLWVVALRFARPPVPAVLGCLAAMLIVTPWAILSTG